MTCEAPSPSVSRGLEFNVAIRTFEIGGGKIELGVGGGITADSVPMLEWRECLHKAAPLLGAHTLSYTAIASKERSINSPATASWPSSALRSRTRTTRREPAT